jgi:hypothetical protein
VDPPSRPDAGCAYYHLGHQLLKGETKQKGFAIGIIFTVIFFTACQKSPSPAASATFDLGAGKTIKTNYSSPCMKGREI